MFPEPDDVDEHDEERVTHQTQPAAHQPCPCAAPQGAVKQVLALRQYSAWVTPASGVLLLSGGTYALLSRIA
jgi:hypothetical protein